MMGDNDTTSSSYANRTTSMLNQNEIFPGDGDEINLETDEVPKSKLRLVNDNEQHDVFSPPAKLSVDDHFDDKQEPRFAQISPEPQTISIKVFIREFEKRGEGMNAYLVYRVETDVEGVVGYTKRQHEVWRRFSDFLGLHEKIVEKYLPKGIVVPIPPEKSLAALTKTKGNSDPANSREIGIYRSRQLERFLRRMVQHPRMRTDCDLRDFLTIEGDLPKSSNTATLSGAGVKKIFKSVGEVFSKMAFHMEEGDRWFEQIQSQFDELDEALRSLHQITESLTSSRKDIGTNSEHMSKALSMLAACEESTSLSRALSALTDTSESVSMVWFKQADADAAKFSEAIGEYISLIASLKEVFDERVRAWQQWQNAQQTLTKKRDQKTKMDLNGKNDRSEQIKVEIEETIQKMDQLEHHFGVLSKNIREEVARFENERKENMKSMLIEYLESLLRTHTELLKLWEAFEPHAQNIQT